MSGDLRLFAVITRRASAEGSAVRLRVCCHPEPLLRGICIFPRLFRVPCSPGRAAVPAANVMGIRSFAALTKSGPGAFLFVFPRMLAPTSMLSSRGRRPRDLFFSSPLPLLPPPAPRDILAQHRPEPNLPSASRKERAVLRIALRETSPAHVNEFEPITKGTLFALIALAPLGMMAAVVMAWRAIKRVFSAPT